MRSSRLHPSHFGCVCLVELGYCRVLGQHAWHLRTIHRVQRLYLRLSSQAYVLLVTRSFWLYSLVQSADNTSGDMLLLKLLFVEGGAIVPTFIFLVVVSLAEGSSVGIARDSYLQNRLAFANAEFRCDWKESISEVFKKSVELEIAYVRAMLKKPDVRVSVQSEFDRNGGVKDNESLEDALTKSLRLQIEGGEVRGKYLFRSGPTPEIHHIDPLDPRKEAAERRKIAPCTPDGAQVIRKREDGRWECLEPYPSPTDTRPLVWLKSTVTVRSILPPVWGDSTVLSAHSHGADMFFSADVQLKCNSLASATRKNFEELV